MGTKKTTALFLFLFLGTTANLFAEEAKLDTGNTAWVLISTALVMFMTPIGLALFYGGMTRTKNMLNTFTMSFTSYALASILWMFWCYSIAFGTDIGGLSGDLSYLFMNSINTTKLTGSIPTYVYAIFQMTFACITVALISGAVVERIKFSSWLLFTILWVTFVYSPICHWVWGGGFIAKMGALDFAGGTVVHINAGVSALVLSLILGKRLNYKKEAILPSSVILTATGAGMLLFGWFGFNAGSQLAADGLAGSAFLVTNSAACIGAITWMLAEWMLSNKPTLLGLASGLVAGLVGITPAAGFVDLFGSVIIGAVSGMLGYFSVTVLKSKLGYDDSLDAFGVHGLCGIWGALATGIFANPSVNELGKGLLYGNPGQLWTQFVSVVVTILYSAILTLIIAYIVKIATRGIRVSKEIEISGLDSAYHGESAFHL